MRSWAPASAALLFVLAGVIVGAGLARAGEPSIGELVDRVEQQRIRDHIETIAVPRNAFEQPEQLQQTADYVQAELESFGYPVTLDPVALGVIEFPNVIGVLQGASCPERVLVVGAHYDTDPSTPGADDDASGVAAMLEIARVLAGSPLPATVWFTGFSFEENGFVGSRQMASQAAEAGTEIVGMYSLEMIAYTDDMGGDFVAVLGSEASVALAAAYRRAQVAHVPDLVSAVITLVGNGEEQFETRLSDHAPFWDQGYQALLVTDTAFFRNPNYHRATDTLDTLDLEFATDVTKAVLATTVEYLTADANADGEADVCSGPLAGTATPTPAATPTSPATPTLPVGSPSATLAAMPTAGTPLLTPAALPETGAGSPSSGAAAAAPWIYLALASALLAGGALVWRRTRRSSR